jgi:hypothetical protein
MSIVANGKEVLIENIPIDKRDDKLIMQFSKKVAETFANAPYNQYMVHESDLSRYISPEEIFGTKDYIPYDQLFSNHQGNGYFYADNPEVAFKIWKEKLLLKDSVLILVRTSNSDEIQGGIFTYKSTLENAFKRYEEWENPLLYAGIQNEEIYRDYEEFEELIQKEIPNYDLYNQNILILNCIFLSPNFRNNHSILFKLCFDHKAIMPDNDNTPFLMELIENDPAFKLYYPVGFTSNKYLLDKLNQQHIYLHESYKISSGLFESRYARFFK